ncbi:MAG: hypothetical protein NTY07_13435 [Bacteroidia bacterium]|nr:hypothetical protein [Bacteroidia bacterium]
METKNFIAGKIRELTLEELKFIDGGDPTKSTSFIYDFAFSVTYLVGRAVKEMGTSQFWIEWEFAIL